MRASEPSPAENPKEISSNDPPELPATTGSAAAASISIATPAVAEGTAPAAVDKPRSSFTSWKQHQGFETNAPWCRLLTESPQNPTISVHTTNFLVGSSKHANLLIRDHSISAILCSIRLTQIFQQLPYERIISTSATDVQTNIGKLINAERRKGDASAVTGASILASLSSPRVDLSHLKPTSPTSGKNYRGSDLPSSPIVNEDELDGQEVNSATNLESEAVADVGAASKILPLDGSVESGLQESSTSCSWNILSDLSCHDLGLIIT
ncbi:UNVERIFIED_CONTAM: hypothetical protein Slati_3400300 [Sesamum latifolium]|uniref:Uncharacterized protein n=1 Tax=Sesamum latifolium TaxID=2727402 RepID=A0AAW2UFF1_9LAMI